MKLHCRETKKVALDRNIVWNPTESHSSVAMGQFGSVELPYWRVKWLAGRSTRSRKPEGDFRRDSDGTQNRVRTTGKTSSSEPGKRSPLEETLSRLCYPFYQFLYLYRLNSYRDFIDTHVHIYWRRRIWVRMNIMCRFHISRLVVYRAPRNQFYGIDMKIFTFFRHV